MGSNELENFDLFLMSIAVPAIFLGLIFFRGPILSILLSLLPIDISDMVGEEEDKPEIEEIVETKPEMEEITETKPESKFEYAPPEEEVSKNDLDLDLPEG